MKLNTGDRVWVPVTIQSDECEMNGFPYWITNDCIQLSDYVETDLEKIAIKLPVIPQFVADWIEKCKEEGMLLSLAIGMGPETLDVIKWLDPHGREEIFTLAWIFGYEVEQERKYHVILPGAKGTDRFFLRKNPKGNIFLMKGNFNGKTGSNQLTEQEIKDYDERYWAFAVEVKNE